MFNRPKTENEQKPQATPGRESQESGRNQGAPSSTPQKDFDEDEDTSRSDTLMRSYSKLK